MPANYPLNLSFLILAAALSFFSPSSPLLLRCAHGFVVRPTPTPGRARQTSRRTSGTTTTAPLFMSAPRKKFELTLDLPPSTSDLQARIAFDPLLDVPSEPIVVRYALPFDLNVSPQKGFAVCTKDGTGGEREGDVLRFTSAWSMGLPRGDGLLTTAASFGGALSWQCSLFDVMKASRWEEVVSALTSNIPSRTDEVVLVFERPIKEEGKTTEGDDGEE